MPHSRPPGLGEQLNNCDQRKLLVLGGLAQHCEIIEDAKAQGLYVIVIDNLDDSPGKRIADESHKISIVDVGEVVRLCRERSIDGVMNYCVDPGQKPYQQICEQLGIPCYGTKEQFNVLTNKDLFYKVCADYGLDIVPQFQLPENGRGFEGLSLEYPVLVKPADGRASKGISVCNGPADIPSAVEKALQFSARKKVIIQKYLPKPEVCAKYFVCEGEVLLTSVSDTHSAYVRGERAYICGKIFPSIHYDEYLAHTDKKVRRLIKGLNIENGPLSFTGFYDEGKFRFFDPSFRLGGGQQWRIEAHISGVDVANCMTQFALNGSMGDLSKIRMIDKKFETQRAVMLYILARTGRIAKIAGIARAICHETVIGHHLSHREGDLITTFGTSDHVVARFLMVSSDAKKLRNDAESIRGMVDVLDQEGESMLLEGFDPRIVQWQKG